MATSLYDCGCKVIIKPTDSIKINWIIPIPTLLAKLSNFVMLSVTALARLALSGIILSLLVKIVLSARLGILSLYTSSEKFIKVFIESSHSLLAAEGIWLINSWNSLVNCGIIITIEILWHFFHEWFYEWSPWAWI